MFGCYAERLRIFEHYIIAYSFVHDNALPSVIAQKAQSRSNNDMKISAIIADAEFSQISHGYMQRFSVMFRYITHGTRDDPIMQQLMSYLSNSAQTNLGVPEPEHFGCGEKR